MHINTITAIDSEHSTKLESYGGRGLFFSYDFQVFILVGP